MNELSFNIPSPPSRLAGDHESKIIDYNMAYAVGVYAYAVDQNEWVYTFCLSICEQMISNTRGLSPKQKEVLLNKNNEILNPPPRTRRRR